MGKMVINYRDMHGKVEEQKLKNIFVNKVELDQTEKIETEFIHPRENIVHRNLELGLFRMLRVEPMTSLLS